MSNQNNSNQEVDIIALFEYFRKGFWNFVALIGGIFVFFFKLLVRLYLLFKKNWILVGVVVLAFTALGKFYHEIFPKPYNYEMVVRANYNSVYELYNFVNSVEKDLEVKENHNLLTRKIGYSIEEIQSIQEVLIEPIEDFDDVLATYYGAKGSPFSPSVRDTIFYKDFTISAFQENVMKPINYSLQKISLISNQPIDPVKFEKALLENVNNFAIFKSQKDARLKALLIKEQSLKSQLQKIDSLLFNLANQKVTSQENGISLRGDSKNNVEDDLLRQSREITDELFSIEVQKENQERILVPYSSIRQVEPNKFFKKNMITGFLFGLILSLLVLLLIETNRAILKYAAANIKD